MEEIERGMLKIKRDSSTIIVGIQVIVFDRSRPPKTRNK